MVFRGRVGRLCLILLCGPLLADGEESAPGCPDLEVLHPSLRAPVESVPDERNAATAWAELKSLTDFSDEQTETLDVVKEEGPIIGPQRREELRRIIEEKAPLLDAFRRGAAMDSYVPRAPVRQADLDFDWRIAFMRVARLAWLHARLAASSGDFEAASRSVDGVLRAIGLFEKGFLIDFIMARGARARVLSEVRTLAAHPDAPVTFLTGLLAVLEARGAARLADAMRFDFRRFTLPVLLGMPEAPDDSGWPAALRDQFTAMDDGDSAAAALLAGHLLDGHPKPFDRGATLALIGSLVLRHVDMAEKPWREVDYEVRLPDAVERGYEAWPEELRATMASRFEGVARELAVARTRLRDVENPLGMLIVRNFAHPDLSVADWRTMHEGGLEVLACEEATRAAIALRIHESRVGELPRALDELVAAKILERVPLDPFSREPLRWSRERRILWSVGSDLEDNGGATDRRWEDDDEDDAEEEDDDEAESAGPFDIVFEVPPVSKDVKPEEERR